MNKEILIQYGFLKELRLIELCKCPFCEQKINMSEFKDSLSEKEFDISGLCQTCQDGFFENLSPEMCEPRREMYIGITRAKSRVVFI